MIIPTKKEFSDAYEKAPQYVQDFIQSDELDAAFEALRATYKLHLDDAGMLADLLNAVVLDLVPLGQFEGALAEHVPRLAQEERIKITREVNEKIFAVLRGRAEAQKKQENSKLEAPSSVVAQKLSTTVVEVPKEVTVPMPSLDPGGRTLDAGSQKPETSNQELGTSKPATNPKYSGGSDPYREPIE